MLTTLAANTHDLSHHGATWADVVEVLTLRNYNTRLVVISTAVLSAAAGLIGSFMLLRKRSLMGDALSHATLPGICVAFLLHVAMGGDGRNMVGLLAGAAAGGLLGVGTVMLITRHTRLKSDAALGIVLSVFFAVGIALMPIAQRSGGAAAGLDTFIYGKPASMVMADAWMIAAVAGLVLIVCFGLFKEFAILCFDDSYAASQGWPIGWLDGVMLALVTVVTVVGLQAVGLILIIAMLIIPPAAARFWTHELWAMAVVAALLGGLSGWLGSTASAVFEDLPGGAIIVVVAASFFGLSMLFGRARGVVPRAWRHVVLSAKVGRQHLLRAVYERVEARGESGGRAVSFESLLAMRSWSARRLRRVIRSARRAGLVSRASDGSVRLTEAGRADAARVVRNHRLWEIYLINYADIAPSHVDRDADMIEHVLDAALVTRLERLLEERSGAVVPSSPHAI